MKLKSGLVLGASAQKSVFLGFAQCRPRQVSPPLNGVSGFAVFGRPDLLFSSGGELFH